MSLGPHCEFCRLPVTMKGDRPGLKFARDGHDGRVDVCNFRLCGVRLTEGEIGEALRGLGSTKVLDCVFEDAPCPAE